MKTVLSDGLSVSDFFTKMQESIRKCLLKMNMVPVEIEENYEKTKFDGVFRYQNVSQSNLDLAPKFFNRIQNKYIEVIPKEEQKQFMEEWVKQYKTERVTVYCNSCLTGVLLGGANGIHILDLITRDLKEE